MAKTIRKMDDPVITVNYEEGGVSVSLPSTVCDNREALRWLGHWVVDAMADHGHVKWMVVSVDEGLSNLSTHIIGTSVADLVRQAIEATSEPAESQPPKKAKKRKGK